MNKALVSYASTGFFSKAVTDYIEGSEKLKPFLYLCSATVIVSGDLKKQTTIPFLQRRVKQRFNSAV
jgi:hypothetical protein